MPLANTAESPHNQDPGLELMTVIREIISTQRQREGKERKEKERKKERLITSQYMVSIYTVMISLEAVEHFTLQYAHTHTYIHTCMHACVHVIECSQCEKDFKETRIPSASNKRLILSLRRLNKRLIGKIKRLKRN
jgi:hypothetical protein